MLPRVACITILSQTHVFTGSGRADWVWNRDIIYFYCDLWTYCVQWTRAAEVVERYKNARNRKRERDSETRALSFRHACASPSVVQVYMSHLLDKIVHFTKIYSVLFTKKHKKNLKNVWSGSFHEYNYNGNSA